MESSFNDATGIIIFTLVVGIVFGSTSTPINTGTLIANNSNPQINIDILHEIGQFLFLSPWRYVSWFDNCNNN